MLMKATNLVIVALLATSASASSEGSLVHHIATATSIEKGQQIWLVAAAEAESARAKIVVKKKRNRGDTTYITFNVVFENLPQGLYSYCFWHSRLMGDGVPPDCGEPVPPAADGTSTSRFGDLPFLEGDWIQFGIRSADGKIKKDVRYSPFN